MFENLIYRILVESLNFFYVLSIKIPLVDKLNHTKKKNLNKKNNSLSKFVDFCEMRAWRVLHITVD